MYTGKTELSDFKIPLQNILQGKESAIVRDLDRFFDVIDRKYFESVFPEKPNIKNFVSIFYRLFPVLVFHYELGQTKETQEIMREMLELKKKYLSLIKPNIRNALNFNQLPEAHQKILAKKFGDNWKNIVTDKLAQAHLLNCASYWLDSRKQYFHNNETIHLLPLTQLLMNYPEVNNDHFRETYDQLTAQISFLKENIPLVNANRLKQALQAWIGREPEPAHENKTRNWIINCTLAAALVAAALIFAIAITVATGGWGAVPLIGGALVAASPIAAVVSLIGGGCIITALGSLFGLVVGSMLEEDASPDAPNVRKQSHIIPNPGFVAHSKTLDKPRLPIATKQPEVGPLEENSEIEDDSSTKLNP